MAFRFRRSVKILPGIKLNFSKSGISTTFGGRGFSVTKGKNGTYQNVGIPGTGISYRSKISSGNASKKSLKKYEQTTHYQPTDKMDGISFEYWCIDLLKESGFKNVKHTGSSGDQGVDIIAEKDGLRYAIQCKFYSSKLGNAPVQEVFAGKSHYNCDVAVVMTNNYFTKSAFELASSTGVLLWDGDVVSKMHVTASPKGLFAPKNGKYISTYALLAFVFALASVVLAIDSPDNTGQNPATTICGAIAVALGIVGFNRTRSRKQRGMLLALLGIVFGGSILLLFFFSLGTH